MNPRRPKPPLDIQPPGAFGPLLLTLLLSCAAAASPTMAAEPGPVDSGPELIQRLRQTQASNLDAIIDSQFPEPEALPGFRVPSPYLPGPVATRAPSTPTIPGDAPGEEADSPLPNATVQAWWHNPARPEEVCAIRFLDAARAGYELRTFASAAAARDAGYRVTHQYRCGSCSALTDLAVYLEQPDLTTPARSCARKWGADRVRQCFQDRIGLSPPCAESWTYNALNTRSACRSACLRTYGLLNLLLHRYPAPNNLPDGSLNACLQCDEALSGPGFKYSAGRTRRGSGIRTAIARPDSESFPVDHSSYFDPPGPSRQ